MGVLRNFGNRLFVYRALKQTENFALSILKREISHFNFGGGHYRISGGMLLSTEAAANFFHPRNDIWGVPKGGDRNGDMV